MSKQPPTAPTESTIGPCPTVSQVSRTPWHWKFTQHLRTTRPPPESAKSKDIVDIYCKYAHHYKFICFFICQNAFCPGREFRTISLNTISFCSEIIDLLQTETLGRQIFGKRQVQYFLDSFTKATAEKFQCLLVDLSPHSDPTYKLRTNILPGQLMIAFLPEKTT